jgi:hypothetical protein
MVAVMGIEKHAAFYRGYEPDQRSLFPVAVVLATLIALWLLVYLVYAVGPQPRTETAHGSLHPAYTTSSSPTH